MDLVFLLILYVIQNFVKISLRLYQNGRIRKLTPEECEKLQTLPVGYTNTGVSDIHRYSSIGNGWTVDVIAHIFGGLR